VPTARAPPDLYEPDDTVGQATMLLSGVGQAHSISPVGDVDWYVFTVTTATLITLETSGPAGDTWMDLYEADGITFITSADDGGAGYFSRMVQVLYPGSYTAVVRDLQSNDEILTYSMSYTFEPTAPGPPTNLVIDGVGGVTLTWSPPADDGGAPISFYIIWSGREPGLLTERTGTPETRWVDPDVTGGGHYYYEVVAWNIVGPGPGALGEVVATAPPGQVDLFPPGLMFSIVLGSLAVGVLVARRLARRPDGPVEGPLLSR